MVLRHNLPPGVQGDTRGHLNLAVDEVVWLHGSGGASVLAEWWGSKQEEQVLFGPVDVRNFSSGSVGNGPVLQHSYPVNTSKEKLKQYLKDASPLPLSLLDRQGQSVGRAAVALSLDEIEGYFPVWSSSQGREIANLHVKLSYREGGEDAQDIPVHLGKRQNRRGKSLKRVTKNGSNDKGRAGVLSSEEGRKTQRVTFSEGEIAPRPLSSSNFSPLSGVASMNTPIADSLITDLLNQSATLRANMRDQLAEAELVLEKEDDEKENLPPTIGSKVSSSQNSDSACTLPSSLPLASALTTPAPPIPWNLSVSRLKQLACVRTLTTTVLFISLDSSLLARLRRPQNQKKGFVAGRLANSSTSAISRQQSPAFFVRFGLPGGKEASFCSRKVSQGGRAEFGESDVSQVTCSPTLLDQWWTSSLDFSLFCRSLGQRTPLLLGTASIGLKHLLDSEAMLSTGLSLALPVYAAQGLARSLGVARAEAKEIVANVSVTLKFGIGEVVKEKKVRPLSPRKAEREGDDTSLTRQNLPTEESNTIRPQTVTLHSSSAPPLQISQPVLALLKADAAPSLPVNCTLVHRTWGGEEVRGANLSCTEVLLVPGYAARTANKQLLSRLLANYLVVEVWQGQQLLGLSKIPTAPLHSGLGNGEPDKVVEAFQGSVQVIGVKDGESVGQLMIGLWAGTLKQLDMLGRSEESSDEKKTEKVDRETMTELAEQFADSVMLDESVTEEGITHVYDTPASETELYDVSKDEDTVREVLQSSPERRPESSDAEFAGCLLLQISVIEGHNLPLNTSLYCTVLGVTSPVASVDDDRSFWDFVAELNIGLDYLTDSRKRLIMKVWNLKGASADAENDQMVGFAAIDISPLQALPCLSGWYNVLDWVGKCRGQISLMVTPLKPVPRFGEQDLRLSSGDPRQMKYVVQGTYSTFPSHLISHTRQIISPVMAMSPSRKVSEESVHPRFNFLPDDPTKSFLEGRLASNLADLDHLSKTLAASLNKGEAQVEQEVQVEHDLKEPSLNDTTFVIAGRQEEEMATGRSIASFSMMQSTIDENLACIKGLAGKECHREELAGGEGCSLAEQRIQEPVPTSLPDLNLVLQDLGLDLDTLQPQVFTDRSRVGPEGGNPEI